MTLIALVVVIAFRSEHVWASNVWIAARGERFEHLSAKKRKEIAKRTGSPKSEVRLSDEERWELFKKTDGGRLPWLFMGIRSYGLLMASKRAPRPLGGGLYLLRLLWLNWLFPIWTGTALLLLASGETNSRQNLFLIVGAVVLGFNTVGSVVGSVLSMFVLGGLSRHHPTWATDRESPASAVAEFGFTLAAMGLALFSAGVFVSVSVTKFGAADPGPGKSWFEIFLLSINTATTGATGSDLTLAGPWGTMVSLVCRLTLVVLTIAMFFAVSSTWRAVKGTTD